MKLLIDIGNTAIKVGSSKGDCFSFLGRFYSSNNIEVNLLKLISNLEVDSVYISSVVPSKSQIVEQFFVKTLQIKPNFIHVGDYCDLKINIDNKDELGVDLYCDLVAAKVKYGNKVLITDLGTASKILLIDGRGEFSSCVIIPGLNLSKKVLSNNAELLPNINSDSVKRISEARNTIDVINSSVYYAHVEAINGLLKRYENEIGYQCRHVFTGGNAAILLKDLISPFDYDENLTLEGIHQIVKGK